MKKKFLSFLLLLVGVFFFSRSEIYAGCTQVGSNETTCPNTQPVACSQNMPTPGVIYRYCCNTQADCDAQKSELQQQIKENVRSVGGNQQDVMCDGGKGIDTAIGCIHVLGSPEQFAGDLLKWAVGVGGGIAFLLIVYASFMIITSAGNPERLKAGQELLTSAISGLILLIFSIFILKFIGVDILKIPGFGRGQ